MISHPPSGQASESFFQAIGHLLSYKCPPDTPPWSSWRTCGQSALGITSWRCIWVPWSFSYFWWGRPFFNSSCSHFCSSRQCSWPNPLIWSCMGWFLLGFHWMEYWPKDWVMQLCPVQIIRCLILQYWSLWPVITVEPSTQTGIPPTPTRVLSCQCSQLNTLVVDIRSHTSLQSRLMTAPVSRKLKVTEMPLPSQLDNNLRKASHEKLYANIGQIIISIFCVWVHACTLNTPIIYAI